MTGYTNAWRPALDPETREIEAVLAGYSVDRSQLKVSRNSLAHTNRIYLVEPGDSTKLIIRAVDPHTYGAVESKGEHLRFELEALNFLEAAQFSLTPRVIKRTTGEEISQVGACSYVAFSFLPGVAVGNFNDLSALNPTRRGSLFRAVGRLSQFFRRFQPKTPSRDKTVVELAQEALIKLRERITLLPQQGRDLVEPRRQFLEAFGTEALGDLETVGYSGLPKQAVHFDLHAGQFLFDGDAVSAILDFDWLRLDSYTSDIASVLAMCCYVYGGPDDGLYVKEQVRQGLSLLRETIGQSRYSKSEEEYLVKLAWKGYLFFQLGFTCEMYASQPNDDNLIDLCHFLNLIVRNDFEGLLAA